MEALGAISENVQSQAGWASNRHYFVVSFGCCFGTLLGRPMWFEYMFLGGRPIYSHMGLSLFFGADAFFDCLGHHVSIMMLRAIALFGSMLERVGP